MEISIASEKVAMSMVEKEPGLLNVISIRDPGDDTFDRVSDLCKEVLPLHFHDLQTPTTDHRLTCPEENHILAAINWCQGKESVLLHCKAGVSRSAAIAVIIGCANGMTPSEAFSKILDPLLHFPNPIIIDIGSGILEADLLSERIKFEDDVSKVFDPDAVNF